MRERERRNSVRDGGREREEGVEKKGGDRGNGGREI
jgi:hypothetical protein